MGDMKNLPVVQPPQPETPTPTAGAAELVIDAEKTAALKPEIVNALSTIYDPEIPVNIFELGLVYDIFVDQNSVVGVIMTLTSPGCPVAQTLPIEVANKLKAIPGVSDAKVDIVWEPEWTKDRMSDAAKLQLGMW